MFKPHFQYDMYLDFVDLIEVDLWGGAGPDWIPMPGGAWLTSRSN